MSSGEVRKVSRQDIQLVQNLIECCLQLYMNQKEVVDTLSLQAKIEPSFTELVWQKLEEENREFFKAYHVRLMLKNQILVFNKLLEKQVELMHKACPSGLPSAPISNGSSSALHQTPACYLSEQATSSTRPDHMFCNGISSSSFANGRHLGQERNHIGSNPSMPTGSMDTSTSMFSTQASNIGRTGQINGSTIKTEASYSNNSEFPFCGDSSFLEVHQPVTDVSAGSFSSSDFTGQQLNDTLLDIDTPSFGLGQMPRNFSFSDLTDDFTHCADILENYGRSPFLQRETNNFEDSPVRELHEDENRRLDTISEGVSYEDFGSD